MRLSGAPTDGMTGKSDNENYDPRPAPPPYDPGYNPAGPYPQPQVQIVHVPVAMPPGFQAPGPGVMLYPYPATTTCPNCNQVVTTVVEYESGNLTFLLSCVLAFAGCIIGCCLIPFCVDACKDAAHYCPQCKAFIGKYKRPLTRSRYNY